MRSHLSWEPHFPILPAFVSCSSGLLAIQSTGCKHMQRRHRSLWPDSRHERRCLLFQFTDEVQSALRPRSLRLLPS